MTVLITLKASEFRRLTAPVLPLTDSDTLPILSALHVQGWGDSVTATATDRYRLGIQRVRVPAPKRLDTCLPAVAVKEISRLFRARRGHDPSLTLSFEDATVQVSTAEALSDDLAGLVGTWHLMPGEFPKVASILRGAQGIAGDAQDLAVNAAFIASFQAAATENDAPLVVSARQSDKPMLLSAGADFVGALMPTRSAEPVALSPRAMGKDWLDTVLAEPKAPARRKARKQAAPKPEAVAS